MPYRIDNNCVYKEGSDKPLKCYDNKKDALAYLRALEAHMPDVKSMMMLSQAETNYSAAGGTVGKACSNCRWFCPPGDGMETMCHLVMGYPAPIVANGLCDRWEATPDMNSEPTPIPVTIVEPMDSEEMALPTNRKGLRELITDTLKSLLQPPSEQAFSVFKAQDGKHYWLARHTGKFVDREGEIIADKAHEEYVTRVQKGLVPLPELWTWHKKGTKHGQADFVWKSGGFVLALGHFEGTPEQIKQAVDFYQKQGSKIKLSHMFHYPKRAKQGRVFYAYNTVEITTLPDGAEAFPYTSFEGLPNMDGITKEQETMILGIGGQDMLKRVLDADAKAKADTKEKDAAGVASKGLENFEGATIPVDKDLEALKTDVDTRLKSVEGLPGAIQALQLAMKDLSAQVATSQQAEANALKKVNDLEKKLLEYEAVAPPASKSDDTILNAREKSLIESVTQAAKTANTPSLIDQAFGASPAVSA